MDRKFLLVLATLPAFTACSNVPKVSDAGGFAAVRTIELRDATDPLVLASSNAARVRQYLAIGLRHRGYAVCDGCAHDAVATVTVREYNHKQQTKVGGLFRRQVYDMAVSEWTLSIVRNGETIYQRHMEHDKPMPIDQLAARQVQDALEQLPVRP